MQKVVEAAGFSFIPLLGEQNSPYCDLRGRIKSSARSLNYVSLLCKPCSMNDNERTISCIQYSREKAAPKYMTAKQPQLKLKLKVQFMFSCSSVMTSAWLTSAPIPSFLSFTQMLSNVDSIVQITKTEIALIEQDERHLVHAKDSLKSC